MAKTIGQLTSATTIGNSDLFVIEQSSQTFKIAASVVRGGLVDADVDAAAAIAFSKLAALDDANILVGNGSNVATKVAVTGDVTISNAGVTAIAAGSVVTADVADAAITPAKLSQPYTLATAQASTSGTSIDFTDIPSWAKRITVMFNGVSTSGTSGLSIQLGTSGGVVESGYSGGVGVGTTYNENSSSFFVYNAAAAANVFSGIVVITTLGSNVWVSSGNISQASNGAPRVSGGSVSLAAALTQVRVASANGTDTFDAGSINIAYEG